MASSPPSSNVCDQAFTSAENNMRHRDVTYTYREYVGYNCYVTGPLTLEFIKRHVPCMRRALRRRERRKSSPSHLPNPMVPGTEAREVSVKEPTSKQAIMPVPEKDCAVVVSKVVAPLEEKVTKIPKLATHGRVMAGGPMGDAQSGGTYLPRADQLRKACAYLSDLKFFFVSLGKSQKDITALCSEAAHVLYEEAVEEMRDDVLVSGAVTDYGPEFPPPVSDDVEFPGRDAHVQYAEDLRLWGYPKHGTPPKLDATTQKYVDFRVRCGPGGTTVFDPKTKS